MFLLDVLFQRHIPVHCVIYTSYVFPTGIPEQPVLSVPPIVVLGQMVVMNCSIRINCPLEPPRLRWIWERGGAEGAGEDRGTERVQTEGETPLLISSLSFTPSKLVKPRVRCDAHHHGNRKSSSIANMNIHCKCANHLQPAC